MLPPLDPGVLRMVVPNLRKRFTAYVIFAGSENRRAWRFLLRRGWRHVGLVVPAYYPRPSLTAVAYSQIVSFRTDCVSLDVSFDNPEAIAQAYLREGATCVIRFPVDQKFTGRYIPRGLFTCVSMVKAMLSVNAWWVWTPEQLARYLLQNGGKLVEKSE